MRCKQRFTSWMLVATLVATLGSTLSTGVGADLSSDFTFWSERGLDEAGVRMSDLRVASVLHEELDVDLSAKQASRLAQHVVGLCRKYGFDPAFILSLIQVESGFRVGVVSPAGAVGLMQLMPQTAEVIAKREGIRFRGARSLKEPYLNLTLGITYLAWLKAKYAGLPPYFHVAAYNIGPARLDELLTRKSFKPVKTWIYFEKIRRGMPTWRNYQAQVKSDAAAGSGRKFGV